MPTRKHKKNLIVSYNNLSDELKALFKGLYPEGYQDFLQKTVKPNGDFIFAVPMETEDAFYMVKFDVKIDTGLVEEDLDKDLYGDDEKVDDGEFAPLSEAIDKEEGEVGAVGALRNGDYADLFEPGDKKEFELAAADMADENGDDEEEEYDGYTDDAPEEDEEDEEEPDDAALLELEEDGLLNDVLNDDPFSADAKKGKKNAKAPAEKSKSVKAKTEKSPKAGKILKAEKTATKPVEKKTATKSEPKASAKKTATKKK